MNFRPPNRDLLSKMFNGNHEMIKEYEKLFNANTDFQEQIDANRKEIDRIEAGAGLDIDGNYIPPVGTNFIDSSTSLADADLLLDTAISVASEKIINKAIDYQALEESQLIIVDATSGAINITLPDPANSLNNDISYKVGITKKDTSANFVNILPFASEFIVGESSQDLRTDGEVLNFITDGTDWYLNN